MATILGTFGNDNNLVGGAGDDAIFGFAGNDFLEAGQGNNFLDGGNGNDSIEGDDGNDVLNGGNGNDRLNGGGGNNVLNGGDGDDTLTNSGGSAIFSGGEGNDTYKFNPQIEVNIIEAVNGGIDTIELSGFGDRSFILPDNVENLEVPFEFRSVTLTGNSLSNTITGGDDADILNGLAGSDSLFGEIGNDILDGGDGSDRLSGGLGSDRLFGGAGADRFQFFAPNEGIDIITDFVAAVDSIQVSVAGFGRGLQVGAISADQFHLGSSAADSSDRFIYNNTSGLLTFDPDGVGGTRAVRIATIIGGPTLTSADIIGI